MLSQYDSIISQQQHQKNTKRTKRDYYEVLFLILMEMKHHSETKYIRLLYLGNGVQIMRFIKDLVKFGMITERKEDHHGQTHRFFKMTPSGLQFLNKLYELNEFIPFDKMRREFAEIK